MVVCLSIHKVDKRGGGTLIQPSSYVFYSECITEWHDSIGFSFPSMIVVDRCSFVSRVGIALCTLMHAKIKQVNHQELTLLDYRVHQRAGSCSKTSNFDRPADNWGSLCQHRSGGIEHASVHGCGVSVLGRLVYQYLFEVLDFDVRLTWSVFVFVSQQENRRCRRFSEGLWWR